MLKTYNLIQKVSCDYTVSILDELNDVLAHLSECATYVQAAWA